jgi:hypothetical protein
MIEEFSNVVLVRDLPEHGLRAGDVGVVVDIYDGGAGYAVEFASLSGDTSDVAVLKASDIRVPGKGEMFAARAAVPAAGHRV